MAPDGDAQLWFPFSTQTLTPQMYAWFCGNHFKEILNAFAFSMLVRTPIENPLPVKIVYGFDGLFMMEWFDLVAYMLCYSVTGIFGTEEVSYGFVRLLTLSALVVYLIWHEMKDL